MVLSLNKEYTKKEAEGFKILEPSKKPVTKSVIKRIFKEPYEYSWLDSEFEIPKLDSSDQFVFTEWIPQRTKYVTSIREKSHNVLIMYFYVLIYSIIVFFFEDGMTTPIDATVRAFSLPIMIYFILGFRSVPKLAKSATVMLFYIYLVMMMFQAGIITANGIFYIYYLYLLLYGIHIIQLLFINPPEFINCIINEFVSPYDPNDLTFIAEMTDSVMANYYTVAGIACLFIYLAFWGLKTRKKESAMSLSNKNLFIRDKTKISRINDVKIALKLVLNPVSPSNYRNALKKMQYNRLASIDSSLYDYGKIPLETLEKVKEKRAVPFYQIIFSVIWVVFFSWLFVTMIISRDQWYDIAAQIGFILVVLVPLITERKNMRLLDLRLKFDRSKVRGPWIYGHTYTTIEFKDVSKEFTEDFLLRCDPSIIHRKWTFRNLMNNLRKILPEKIEEPI